MKYRKLRIAWSVTWGVAAVLLIALWVRSYSVHDVVYGRVPLTNIFSGDSRPGMLHIASGHTKAPVRWSVVGSPGTELEFAL